MPSAISLSPMEVADSVDSLASLEERINRAVQIISELRSENDGLRSKLGKSDEQLSSFRTERDEALAMSEEFQKENGALEGQIQKLTEEVETLREERKQVKGRIEKLLSQLDLLSAT